jgi:hypothetical protein
MIIHPYKLGSRSAKRIRAAVNALSDRKVCWVLQRKPRHPRALIINWGGQEIHFPEGQCWIVNPPSETQVMADKIKFFERTKHDKNLLQWTTDRSTASEWGTKGEKVFVRHLTRGSGGRGIDVWSASGGTVIPMAPLYTRHQKKTHEYRVHMGRALNGSEFSPILVQRKVWRPELNGQPKSWDVRSHDNGFIFQAYPEDKLTTLPKEIFRVATTAMAKYFPEMHFAALDVLYHQPSDTAVICEGNTAPGLENHTVDVYAKYFLELEADFKKERLSPWSS